MQNCENGVPTAEVTETAGVKIPSAMVRAVPSRALTVISECKHGVRRVVTQTSSGHRRLGCECIESLEDERCSPWSLSPVRVRSASRFLSSGGYKPWNRANVPPSPAQNLMNPRRVGKWICWTFWRAKSETNEDLWEENSYCIVTAGIESRSRISPREVTSNSK